MSRACGGCKNILRFISCLILTHKRVRSCACACNVLLVLSLKKKNVLTIRASNHSDLKTPE